MYSQVFAKNPSNNLAGFVLHTSVGAYLAIQVTKLEIHIMNIYGATHFRSSARQET